MPLAINPNKTGTFGAFPITAEGYEMPPSHARRAQRLTLTILGKWISVISLKIWNG
jgi:hypothetical protein